MCTMKEQYYVILMKWCSCFYIVICILILIRDLHISYWVGGRGQWGRCSDLGDKMMV